MIPVLVQQGQWFLMSLCIGVAIAVSYDLLRVLRRIVKHGNLLVAVEDVCYWLAWTYITLFLLHTYGDGCLHGYMLLGVILGIILGVSTIGSALIKICIYMLCLTKKGRKTKRKC